MLVVARNERSLGVLLLPRIHVHVVITEGLGRGGGVAQLNKVCVFLLLSFSRGPFYFSYAFLSF